MKLRLTRGEHWAPYYRLIASAFEGDAPQVGDTWGTNHGRRDAMLNFVKEIQDAKAGKDSPTQPLELPGRGCAAAAPAPDEHP